MLVLDRAGRRRGEGWRETRRSQRGSESGAGVKQARAAAAPKRRQNWAETAPRHTIAHLLLNLVGTDLLVAVLLEELAGASVATDGHDLRIQGDMQTSGYATSCSAGSAVARGPRPCSVGQRQHPATRKLCVSSLGRHLPSAVPASRCPESWTCKRSGVGRLGGPARRLGCGSPSRIVGSSPRGAPDEAHVDTQAPVDASTREADENAVGNGAPGGVLGRAVKADLRQGASKRQRACMCSSCSRRDRRRAYKPEPVR